MQYLQATLDDRHGPLIAQMEQALHECAAAVDLVAAFGDRLARGLGGRLDKVVRLVRVGDAVAVGGDVCNGDAFGVSGTGRAANRETHCYLTAAVRFEAPLLAGAAHQRRQTHRRHIDLPPANGR